MSTEELHATAMISLFYGRNLLRLSPWMEMALTGVLVLFLAISSQYTYVRPLFRMLLAVHGITWLAAIALPGLLRVHPPAAGIMVALTALTFLIMRDRYTALLDEVRLFRLDFGDMVRRRLPGELPDTREKSSPLFHHVDRRMFRHLRAEVRLIEDHLARLERDEQKTTGNGITPIRGNVAAGLSHEHLPPWRSSPRAAWPSR